MPQARMKNPALLIEGALPAMINLSKVIRSVGVDEHLLELAHLRASQVNGCSVCVDLGGTALTRLGVPAAKILAVSAWTDSAHFSDEERAVLAAAEQTTRLADGAPGLTDEAFEALAACFDEPQIAAILLHIGLSNLWNRINDATHQVPGGW